MVKFSEFACEFMGAWGVEFMEFCGENSAEFVEFWCEFVEFWLGNSGLEREFWGAKWAFLSSFA